MKESKPSTRFWITFGILNLLAIVFPLCLFKHAGSNGRWLAEIVLSVGFFLLFTTDMVSIAVAYAVCEYEAQSGHGGRHVSRQKRGEAGR